MPWFYAVAEREHALQNPTTVQKIRLLGDYLRLDESSRVVDLGCGRAGPAIVLADTFGCRVLGVEKAPEFAAAARERVARVGLGARVDILEQDARDFRAYDESFDAALCLGASFIWDGLPKTLAVLTRLADSGGHVAVGEPYWRTWPPPGDLDYMGYTNLTGTVERFTAAGLSLVGLIAASVDDWDAYESLHWRALEEWLAENPADADAPQIRRDHETARVRYLEYQRALLGWAIFVGWKRSEG